ncbi:ubiquitin-specific protease doa4, partial [Coemansia sp. RSA 2706]
MASSQNSHTSDLIKRFETLSSPKSATKPTTLTRRGAATKRTASAPKDDAGSAAIATIEAAQSMLSAAIAHSQTPPQPNWQRQLSSITAAAAQPSSLPAPPRAGMSLEAPTRRSRRGSHIGGMARAATFNNVIEPQESQAITALNRRAEIDDDLDMPANLWLEYAQSCIEDAQQCQSIGDYETAFVKYTMAGNVYSKKLLHSRSGNSGIDSLKYAKLRTDVATWVADELEQLRGMLDNGAHAVTPRSSRPSSTQLQQPARRAGLGGSTPFSPKLPAQVAHSMAEHHPMPGASQPLDSALSNMAIVNQSRENRRVTAVIGPESLCVDEESSHSDNDDDDDGIFDHDIEVAAPTQSHATSRANSNTSSATDISSMLSYHAPTNGRPRVPAYPPASIIQSQSRSSLSSDETPDSDAVLDFMQRNNSVCPPQSQIESRRPSARSLSVKHSSDSLGQQSPKPPLYRNIDMPQPVATTELRPVSRPPPPVPLPVLPSRPQLPPRSYQNSPMSFAASRTAIKFRNSPSVPPPNRPPIPLPVHQPGGGSSYSVNGQQDEPLFTPNGTRLYSHQNAVGSDPALSGQLQSGSNPRNSAVYEHPEVLSPTTDTLSPQSRRISHISDSGVFGVTGLKNFGNTCFMNSVIQCLIGTKPLTRYFMRGEWKKDLIKTNQAQADVVMEFSKVVESMWQGQYSSISPKDFRIAIASCSEQFKGNGQEDAHEFASFLLDTLHEMLNRMHPRPPPDREPTFEEEIEFEQLTDEEQSEHQWEKYMRRNSSIVNSIFQGQIQSRLTCMSCQHTSTTYHTFTELSLPIPEPRNSHSQEGPDGPAAEPNIPPNYSLPVNIYQCLDAFSETEVLDGDDKWHCPQCMAKRPATKRLMVSRLPLVLIVHLKRFSTIGHFREKLDTNVLVPTFNMCLQKYVTFNSTEQPTTYNLYAVANHYGSMSSGHYTASVSD